MSVRVAFFGSDRFALPSLYALINSHSISCVEAVLPPFRKWDKRRLANGRGAPSNDLHELAKECRINVHSLTHGMSFDMREWQWPFVESFDLGVVVSFGYFLPDSVISRFRLGVVNVHPSLLPKYRGASPISAAIRSGDVETGVSVMTIEPGRSIDHGRVIVQQTEPIEPHDTFMSLAPRLAHLGADMVVDVAHKLIESDTVKRVDQSSFTTSQPSRAPKVRTQDTVIEWNKHTSVDIYNMWRAHYGLLVTPLRARMPDGKELSIFKISAPHEQAPMSDVRAGTLVYNREKKVLSVACADRMCLELQQMKLPGKSRIVGKDFYNGFMSRSNRHIVLQ